MSRLWRATIFDRNHPQVREFGVSYFPLAHTWTINASTAWTTRVEITLITDGKEFERASVTDYPSGKMPWRARVFCYDTPDVMVNEFEDLENAQNWVLHKFRNRTHHFEMYRTLPLSDPPKPYVSDNVWRLGDKYYEKQVQL